jgi:peptidoglycan/xylan/chitin deacetylase (PgdA/CDA1 family)
MLTIPLSDSIALAFDDGPAHNFTDKILDLFDSYQMKATFFVTGHDFERAINDPKGKYVKTLRRMHAAGHQIGSHTWTHENLTKLTDSQVVNQIHYNEMALRNVLGFIPTYFRPPYLRCEQNCLPVMKRLGYHVIMKNLETKGMLISPTAHDHTHG